MLFTSFNFFVFITVLFVVYYVLPKRYQWKILLIASYLFYFIAGPKYIIYILLTTISTYLVSIRITKIQGLQSTYLKAHKEDLSKEEKKEYKAIMKSKQWKWLVFNLVFNFGILAIVKYSNFTIANINGILQHFNNPNRLTFLDIALPMGISFYTFQSMGYIIDIYRGKYEVEKNIFKVALFVSFFPQLVQGPISRFDDLSKTLYSGHAFQYRNISFGIQRMIWGYFKKVVIADRMLVAVSTLTHNTTEYKGTYVLVLMLFYSFQLYADFTGGIDITIGIAEVLGIRVKENFNSPFLSKSITDFWRRWHISLGSWFREYLFYPISVARPMLRLSKFSRKHLGDSLGKRVPVYIATITVWTVTGIWHGGHWNFVVWGLMNGLFIILSEEFDPFSKRFHQRFQVKDKLYFQTFQVIRTTLLVSSLRLFDVYRDVPLTFKMFGSMFTTFNFNILYDGSLLKLGLGVHDYFLLFISLMILFASSYIKHKGSIRIHLSTKPLVYRYLVFYLLIISILVFGAYGVGFDSSQFIYNQF